MSRRKVGFDRVANVTGLPGGQLPNTGGQPSGILAQGGGNSGSGSGINWGAGDISNAVSAAGSALAGILSGIGSILSGKDNNTQDTNGGQQEGPLIPAAQKSRNSNIGWIIVGGVLFVGILLALIFKKK